jgi:hypothetical protein
MKFSDEDVSKLLKDNPELEVHDYAPKKLPAITVSTMAKGVLENKLENMLTVLGAPPWVREFVFLKGRKFRADFAWPEQMVIIEVNGGIFVPKSGHRSVQGLIRDYEKQNLATLDGWSYFELAPPMVNPDHIEPIIDFIKVKTT